MHESNDCKGPGGRELSLAGAATSIIFVCLGSRPTYFCRDKTRQKFCRDKLTFVATNKVFVVTNHIFVATNVCLLRQNVCRDKHVFVSTNICRDKSFVGTKNSLSQQTEFCRYKRLVSASILLYHVCRDRTFVVTKMLLVAVPASDREGRVLRVNLTRQLLILIPPMSSTCWHRATVGTRVGHS